MPNYILTVQLYSINSIGVNPPPKLPLDSPCHRVWLVWAAGVPAVFRPQFRYLSGWTLGIKWRTPKSSGGSCDDTVVFVSAERRISSARVICIAAFHSCEKAINGCPRLRPLSWRVRRSTSGCAFFNGNAALCPLLPSASPGYDRM